MLGILSRAIGMLGKHYATEPHPNFNILIYLARLITFQGNILKFICGCYYCLNFIDDKTKTQRMKPN